MKRISAIIGLLLGLIFISGELLAASLKNDTLEDAVSDLVVNHIDITTGFNGAKLDIYGMHPAGGDIIIILRGPDKSMNVRRKEKTLAGWRYGQEMQFNLMPSFYMLAATQPIEKLLSLESQVKQGVGFDALPFKTQETHDAQLTKLFKDAFIRNQEEKHLVSKHIVPITLLGKKFFKASFYLPHNVPVGAYTITVLYLENQKIIAKNQHELFVAQVGTNSSIKKFSQIHPVMYGVLCVLLALFAGWVSNRLKRIL